MKNTLIKVLNLLMLPDLFRFSFQKKSITVIYYHDISAAYFEKQVKYLVRKYNVITIEDLYSYLYEDKAVPNYSLLISFDDGHIGNHSLLSIFIKYNIKPVIFLTAGIVGTNQVFWFHLPFPNSKFKENLKKIQDKERRRIINQQYKSFTICSSPEALTIEQIKEMRPFVNFQSHTMTHPCLPNTDDRTAEYEIVESKKKIEQIVEKPVFSIAYPNGNISDRDIYMLKEAGYLLGFAATKGYIYKNANPFLLNRISINDTSNYYEFKLRVSGIWYRIKNLIK